MARRSVIERRRLVIAAVVLVLAAAGAVAVGYAVRAEGGRSATSGDDGAATSLARVQRRTLATQTQFNGTLGYSGSYTVLAQVPGTVTWLPPIGRVIREGQVLYRVDGSPVVLLYGHTPAYRALAAGVTAADVTGADVAQLNHDLVALGCASKADVGVAWNAFNWATEAGVAKLQKRLGVEQTGRLALGAIVFLPTAARVTTVHASLGGPANGPLLSATSTARTVSVALDASLQSEARHGDRVTITLPDGSTAPGRVTSVGTVATASAGQSGGGSGSGATVPVTIRPNRAAATGWLDKALVQVAVTDQTVRNVLAAPVVALLARAGGGYAIEMVAGDGTHRLIPVQPGVFDDAAGMVQVSGPGLAAGVRVVVPGND